MASVSPSSDQESSAVVSQEPLPSTARAHGGEDRIIAGDERLAAAADDLHPALGAPRVDGYPNELRHLDAPGHFVAYDETRGNPAWVAYTVTLDEQQHHKRPRRFTVDHRTSTRVGHGDYTHSGYDRGHLAPNHAIAASHGREAQLATFAMSNVVPQKPALNQGPWRRLEQRIADHTAAAEQTWVMTGPLYDQRVERMAGGKVEIPDAFWKVVVDELPGGGLATMAAIMPQEAERRAGIREHLVSIDEIEQASGLDLFSALPDEIEERLEGRRSEPLWDSMSGRRPRTTVSGPG